MPNSIHSVIDGLHACYEVPRGWVVEYRRDGFEFFLMCNKLKKTVTVLPPSDAIDLLEEESDENGEFSIMPVLETFKAEIIERTKRA